MDFLSRLAARLSKKDEGEEVDTLKRQNKLQADRITALENHINHSKNLYEKMKADAKTLPPNKAIELLQNQVIGLEMKLFEKKDVIDMLKKELSLYNPDVLKKDFSSHQLPTRQAQEEYVTASTAAEARFGISAENRSSREVQTAIQPKSPQQVEFIRNALNRNMFLRGFDPLQLDKLIECMSTQTYKAGSAVISEGEFGTQLYVLERGNVKVFRKEGNNNKHIAELSNGAIFGELAILYNCRRTASVTAQTDILVWCLDRKYFQVAVKKTAQMMRAEYLRLLKTVDKLKSLPDVTLMKIADCLEEGSFEKGEYIIRQGDTGDTFYIIESGQVKVTRKEQVGANQYKEAFVCNLQNGDYFGEGALLTEDKRSANVIVQSELVTVLMLDREEFQSFVGSISDLSRGQKLPGVQASTKSLVEDDYSEVEQSVKLSPNEEAQLKNVPIEKLQIIKILGQGGFGCVKLVLVPGIPQRPFALKSIRKAKIIKSGQEQHILAEKNIMLAMKSSFIGRLYRTYKDEFKVYLLMDAYLGGELYRLLKAGPLEESKARFCACSVLEALDYLHTRGIAYRDMKPENLMIDQKGYVKLVDFGFAKHIKPGTKTYTFCGTPEYFPPEILSNKGHDCSADIWSYGILCYELLSKTTPFFANDDITVYENILSGIDGVRFNKRVPKSAEILIRGLCKTEPRERIGYQKGGFTDVRKQRWFQGFDWLGLKSHRLPSPFRVEIQSPTDTRNFDLIHEEKIDFGEDRKIISRSNSNWDASF